MSWMNSFEKWTKGGTSINDILKKVEKTSPYLVGKEGWLPNWQIKGKGLKEIYAPEQYLKAGKMIREGIGKRATPLATGIFGIGTVEYAQGKEGWMPDWGRPGQFPKVVDTSGDGKGLVNIVVPEFPKIPEIPAFPTMPEIPNIDLSGIGEGLAAGLAGLGAGLGGGLPEMPGIPSMGLTNEEGEPNLLLIGGLACIALKVLGGRK